jgi:hypothetical protein
VGGYVRNPDTARRVWRARPKDEWVEHSDESVRIVSDEIFQRAQVRTRIRSSSDARMKSGGKPKYLLSGLLHCGICNAHYILHDARSYACAGHRGGACDNHIRVRRDALEAAIIGPLRDEMLAPERVVQMAREMQRDLLERMHRTKMRAIEQPQELAELDARIARLRVRLTAGDPDMTPTSYKRPSSAPNGSAKSSSRPARPSLARPQSYPPSCRTQQSYTAGRSPSASTARTRRYCSRPAWPCAICSEKSG